MRKNNVDMWFSECYEQYADGIFRFCLMKTSSREVALDLSQEAFTKLWDHVRGGREARHPRALLFAITRNLIIDYYRKKKTESLDAHIDAGNEPAVEAAGETDAAYEEALAMIRSLDEPYREAVYLRFVEELAPRDIAEVIGEKPNVISIRITRGMKMLREKMHV